MQLPLGWTGFIANTRIRTFTPFPLGGARVIQGSFAPFVGRKVGGTVELPLHTHA